MRQKAPTSEPGSKDRPVPPCIAALLQIVRRLLGYGRHLDQALPEQAAHPRFPTLAAGFGTHDVGRILAYIHRGLLRAMMLERYLLARAAHGRDIDPVQPPGPAEPTDIEALVFKFRAPRQPRRRCVTGVDDPLHFAIPTLRELESQVRRRPVGRTIAEICMDLGIAAAICDGVFWDEIYRALLHFGANLERFFGVLNHRRQTFQKERDKRPETWTFDWRDRPRDALRQILGFLPGGPAPAT